MSQAHGLQPVGLDCFYPNHDMYNRRVNKLGHLSGGCFFSKKAKKFIHLVIDIYHPSVYFYA
jgi:hypothetical protein